LEIQSLKPITINPKVSGRRIPGRIPLVSAEKNIQENNSKGRAKGQGGREGGEEKRLQTIGGKKRQTKPKRIQMENHWWEVRETQNNYIETEVM